MSNPETPSNQKLGEGFVVESAHLPRRRVAALSIALVTLFLQVCFVALVGFASLELIFASAVWIIVCLPLAALVDRWGVAGFIVGIPVGVLLTLVAFLLTMGIAIALGIEILPTPN